MKFYLNESMWTKKAADELYYLTTVFEDTKYTSVHRPILLHGQ